MDLPFEFALGFAAMDTPLDGDDGAYVKIGQHILDTDEMRDIKNTLRVLSSMNGNLSSITPRERLILHGLPDYIVDWVFDES